MESQYSSVGLFDKFKSEPYWVTLLKFKNQQKNHMFGIFKKKTEVEKLQSKYEALLKEAFELSKINRSKSDQKTFEADEIYKQIETLSKKQ
tara:strand:- start:91 stop:363 length:273 start_codon:yes stop_codon:yes gene_type:complete